MTTRAQLQEKSIGELREIASAVGIETDGLQKSRLISQIMDLEGTDESASDTTTNVDLPAATPRSGDDGDGRGEERQNGDDRRGRRQEDSSGRSISGRTPVPRRLSPSRLR